MWDRLQLQEKARRSVSIQTRAYRHIHPVKCGQRCSTHTFRNPTAEPKWVNNTDQCQSNDAHRPLGKRVCVKVCIAQITTHNPPNKPLSCHRLNVEADKQVLPLTETNCKKCVIISFIPLPPQTNNAYITGPKTTGSQKFHLIRSMRVRKKEMESDSLQCF